MGLFGFRKSDTKVTIGVEDLGNYMNKPRYKECDFPPVFDENGRLIGFNITPKEEVAKNIREIRQSKIKRNTDFDKRIVADGRYKGIDEGIAKKYGNYQNTKGYRDSVGER